MEAEHQGKMVSEMKSSGFLMAYLEEKENNRMFNFVMKTWNPVVGCLHDCSYCWARKLAETKLKKIERYKNGFKPKLIHKELSKRFRGEIVFVSDMGDLWGEWVSKEWIFAVLDAIKKSPEAGFLFLTKNPARYLEFLDFIPKNVIIGATIETNRNTSSYSKAPLPIERIKAMQEIRHQWNNTLMISIEPITDFDFDIFPNALEEIQPDFMVIGKDNYRNNLPEPALGKISSFAYELKSFTRVIFKSGLRNQLLKSFKD